VEPLRTSSDAHARFLQSRHLPGLDGLRGLAILPVIWHHATPRPLPGFWGKGAVGVDLFFALSGFLITTLLLRERRETGEVRLREFYARRSLRIFPLYYLVLGFYALRALQTRLHSETAQHFLDGLVFHATYTANWFLDYSVPFPVMFAFSWSLCVEEQFYWLWPGLVKLIRSRFALGSLMVAAIVVDHLTEHLVFASTLPPGSLGFRIVSSFAVPIGMGSILALLFDTPRGFGLARRVLGLRWSAPCALALTLWFLSYPATPYLWLSGALVALVGAAAIRSDSGLAWLLEQRWLKRIGTLSYAAYLVHITALGLVRKLWPEIREHALVVFALGLPLSLLLAELAHRVVERPALRLKARFH
jgi:peptidoglycan/LPS O-acetylase OafA/YrhL